MDPLYDPEYDEPSAAHSLLTPGCDEESMDIYSGLGDTPTHTAETPAVLFSPRLKASLDLYEEILTEEVRSKDSSFEELKSRFLAAQNQIEELRSRLTQTETQNTGLSTENLRLKKNISALLKTARQEVLRKDQEIQRLNQRSGMNTYNPRGNGQWRTLPDPHTNTPPPARPLPHPGPSNAAPPIAPASRTAATPAATPPYPPPPQHRPGRTPSAGSSTSAPPASQTTPLIPPSRALPQPQPRRTSLTHSSATPAAPPNPPAPQPRASRSSSTSCRPPAPPTETAPPLPQQSKNRSNLSTTCKPSPPPPKHRPSRTSSTSSLPCRPPAPPTESPLPSPSQSGLGKKLSRISSTSTPSAPPTDPPAPPSLPLPKSTPIRTSSRISMSKEPSPPLPLTLDPPPPPPPTVDPPPPPPPTLDPPPPPPPTLDPPPPPPQTLDPPPPTVDPPPPTLDPPPPTMDPPPPPPPPVVQPPPPSPLREDVRPERVSEGEVRPDTTSRLEVSRSKRPSSHPTRSARLDLEETDKPQEVDSQSSSELPAGLCEPDTPRPSKHKEQEPKSQTRSQPTEKRLKSGSEPGKDCETNHRNRSRRAEKESRTKHRSHRLLKSSRSQEAEEHHRSESGESPSSGSLDRKQDPPESNQKSSELRESRLRDSVREHRREKHGDRTDEKRASGSSRDRRNTAPKLHPSGAGESSKRKGDRADPSGADRRKSERRREEESGIRERGSEKHKDSGRKRRQDDGRRRPELRGEKSTKDLEKPSEEEEEEIGVPAGTQCLTENSPNRKLCFMETLNLTLSPVKKPLSQQAEGEEEEEGEILSREDEDQPNLEEFLIIDEIESSMTEMEIDHDKQNPKPSPAVQTSAEETRPTGNGKEDQGLTTTQTRVEVVSERAEVPPVASPSTEGTATESIGTTKPPAQKLPCPSANSPVVMEELETLNLHGVETRVSISEDGKDSPSQNNRPGNLSEVIEPAQPMVLQSEPDLQESPSTAAVDSKKLSSPCPLSSAEKVTGTVVLSPSSSPVAEEVTGTESLPGSVPRPVSGEVDKSGACLSPITSPVSEGVDKTRCTPCPLENPVPGEVNKLVSGPCPITRLVAGEVPGKVRPEGPQSPPDARPPPRSLAYASDPGDVDRPGGSPKGSDTVSSTITLDALPHGDISLPEAIYVLTHADDSDRSSDGGGGFSPGEPGSSAGCVGVSKVSSTTTEDTALPGRRESVQERTPLKGYGFCELRPQRRAGPEPSSSAPPLLYDEDSMMLTLRNLRSIPDVISPLRSPMAPARRPPAQRSSTKPAHVKSLQRDFYSSLVFHSLKPNPNRETKHPDNPSAPEPVAVTSLSPPPGPSPSEGPSPSASDLEEGEILSDSNEAPADVSPPQSSKPTRPAKPRPSPRTARRSTLKGVGGAPPASTPSPSSGKSRFKKVCPGVEQAPFGSVAEVMDTLKKVRFQIRKKYMKLHKVFPKKSFYAMMDHFQQSFMEYVESAGFGQISGQVGELKARLRKLVASVFGKVMNNGIVNRIFDQQATNLKSRLWEFVEVQLDYLFLDIQLALNSFCRPVETQPAAADTEHGKKVAKPKNGKIPKKSPGNASPKKSRSPKEKRPVQRLQRRIRPCPVAPARTGLGRGKDIRIICMERRDADASLPPRRAAPSPEKGARTSLLLPHGGSTQDRSDYDILTEQQASSLTFNLVRDTQMGEIFKCLMQGSDLLDASGAGGDHSSWSLSTPRKEGPPGDGLLCSVSSPSKFLSPSKFASPGKFVTPTKFLTSPSRLMGAWSGLSPVGRLGSPPPPRLLRTPLHPALFDESCLLELPSGSGVAAQRSYALLAEDLAVSLTIPSPLKSDSHLSFLQQQPAAAPRALDMMSTPESVISAHFGEDALLDGEDAWEQQELHLALDTDHSDSSCCSSSAASAPPAGGGAVPGAMLFQFKPHLPVQAVVMERSNDHFILKIRQSAADAADVTLTAADEDEAMPTAGHKATPPASHETTPTGDDSLSQTLTEEVEPDGAEPVPRALFLEKNFGKSSRHLPPTRQKAPPPEEEVEAPPADPERPQEAEPSAELLPPPDSASSADEMEVSTASEGRLAIVEDGGTPGRRGTRGAAGRKRRCLQQQQKSSGKRARKEEEEEGRGHRRRSKKAVASPRVREPRGAKQGRGEESPLKTPPRTPSGLSAKNLVKKKGEVVVAWTREEDRSILLDLKTKGASRETFSVLSEKLNKTSAQIAERFSQLMKLFKKQEKRSSP